MGNEAQRALQRRTLTVDEVAAQIGVGKSFVYALVKRREIRFFKLGRRLSFLPEFVQDYMGRNTYPPIAPQGDSHAL